MKNQPDAAGEAGLKFFGRISASISHEFKNVLSIINETAGLLEDLTHLAQKGAPIDAGRLQTAAKKIQQQVGRADGIIQNMNRFSHSVDRALLAVDMRESLTHLMALTRRITDMKGVKVMYTPEADAIMVTASPFFLQALLWHVLDFASGKAGEGKTVAVSAAKDQQKAAIRFSKLEALATGTECGFPGDTEAALLRFLGAELSLSPGSILVTLPAGSGY